MAKLVILLQELMQEAMPLRLLFVWLRGWVNRYGTGLAPRRANYLIVETKIPLYFSGTSRPWCQGGAKIMSGTHLQTGVYKSGRPVKDWQIRRMIKKLRSLCPWIELSDAPILRRWCELEVLCSRAYAALRESGPTNAEGEARRLLNDYRMLVLAQNIIGAS